MAAVSILQIVRLGAPPRLTGLLLKVGVDVGVPPCLSCPMMELISILQYGMSGYHNTRWVPLYTRKTGPQYPLFALNWRYRLSGWRLSRASNRVSETLRVTKLMIVSHWKHFTAGYKTNIFHWMGAIAERGKRLEVIPGVLATMLPKCG